jgi:transglutaminase/protease-like cytokinesis protein 3
MAPPVVTAALCILLDFRIYLSPMCQTVSVALILFLSITCSAQDSLRFAHASKAPKTQDLKYLVRYLKKGTKDDREVVETITYWIAQNIEYSMAMKKNPNLSAKAVSAESVLKYKKTICAGYSNLFQAMCDLANIKCFNINGIAQHINDKKTGQTDHAWNAVFLNDKWHLVDPTWASGSVRSDEKYIKKFKPEYLFADPATFVINHFPEDNQWQLLSEPITLEQFFSSEWDQKRHRWHYRNFSDKQYEAVKLKMEEDSVSISN